MRQREGRVEGMCADCLPILSISITKMGQNIWKAGVVGGGGRGLVGKGGGGLIYIHTYIDIYI